MADEYEPSILEYARFHGLAFDHCTANQLWSFIDSEKFISASGHSDSFEITGNVATPAKERLLLSKDAAAFLSYPKVDHCNATYHGDALVRESLRSKNFKMEVPLLRTDHACDMDEYGAWIIPNLLNHRLPPAKTNEEEDEGLTWPSSYHKLRLNTFMKSESEKLTVSKEVFLYLMDVTQVAGCGAELPKFCIDREEHTRNGRRETLTPPLLPMSPVMLPYVPSSDTGALELLSDQGLSTHEELSYLETDILENDRIRSHIRTRDSESSVMLVSSDRVAEVFNPLKDIEEQPQMLEYKRTNAEDLKVEVPLTPLRSEKPPLWRREHVSFQEALVEAIPDPPSPIPSPGGTSLDDIDHFFMDFVRPIAEEADRRIEQEQLHEADTTQRVQVPIMDFSRPTALWKNGTTNKRRPLTEEMKAEHFANSFWPLHGKVSRSLPWAPFPANLAKVAVSEEMEASSVLEAMLVQPDSLDHNILVWKPEGLRSLGQSDSDEDELAYDDSPQNVDMQSLVRKRKYELKDGECNLKRYQVNDFCVESGSANPDTTFSALNAINDFINVRGGQNTKKRLTKASHFPIFQSAKEPNRSEVSMLNPDPVPTPSPPPEAGGLSPIALPELTVCSVSSSFILSSSFLINRPLLRIIEALYPIASFVERDFTFHHTMHLLEKGTTLTDDADILLSPSAGLIITTLQKLAQRSLPGTSALSPTFNRILHTASSYTTLYILVTDDVSATPSAASFVSLTNLYAFLAFLPIAYTPTVLLIPKTTAGKNQLLSLATYIVYLMITHATTLEVHQEETNWEIFLRRAGLNAFAAQLVLDKLKPPALNRNWESVDAVSVHGNGEVDEKMWGLSAFVRMSRDERIKFLGGIIEQQLAERVGNVLEGRW